MSATFRTTPDRVEPSGLRAGLALQEEGLRLLLAEMWALQALIPVGDRDRSTDAETEAAFDNMPV